MPENPSWESLRAILKASIEGAEELGTELFDGRHEVFGDRGHGLKVQCFHGVGVLVVFWRGVQRILSCKYYNNF